MAPFAALVGIEITVAGAEEVVGRVRWREELGGGGGGGVGGVMHGGGGGGGGVMHGGVLIALADHLGAVCTLLNLPEGAGTATITSSTNFLLPVRGGEVVAVSRPLRVGRTVVTVQTELRDGEGRLVAQVVQAQAVLRG
jgi:uncharacterized protein (TIGR00369 family)